MGHENPGCCTAHFSCFARKCSSHCVWNRDFLKAISATSVNNKNVKEALVDDGLIKIYNMSDLHGVEKK